MMDAIRKYLISLCTAALLCALVRALVPGGRMKKLCSLLCGIFLMTAALSGISGWQLSDFAPLPSLRTSLMKYSQVNQPSQST